MRRLVGTLVAASVAVLALDGAVAPAATSQESKIVVQGTGTYRVQYVLESHESFALSASFKFRTVFPRARFTRGVSGGHNLSSNRASSYSGAWTASVTMPGAPRVCSGTGKFGHPSPGTPAVPLDYTWSSHTGALTMRAYLLPNDKLRTVTPHADDCAGELPGPASIAYTGHDFWADWVRSFSRIPGPSMRFHVPGAVLADQSATVKTFAVGPKLPAACRTGAFRSCTQSFKWTSSVTFAHIG